MHNAVLVSKGSTHKVAGIRRIRMGSGSLGSFDEDGIHNLSERYRTYARS